MCLPLTSGAALIAARTGAAGPSVGSPDHHLVAGGVGVRSVRPGLGVEVTH